MSGSTKDVELTEQKARKSTLLTWASVLVWPCFLCVPLLLTVTPLHYSKVFRPEWYEYTGTPKPLGLSLGILAVAVGQFFTLVFFYVFKYHTEATAIQSKGARPYEFLEGLKTHLAQPEGFGMLVGYLCFTWMLNLMPQSYYSFDGHIQLPELCLCLVIQDGIQYLMHRLEHDLSAAFYQASHKPHHRFTNPRLFDAFNGSVVDTFCMIIVPLLGTAHIVRTANVWTYMAFGSTYACWLTLIHSEYKFVWDSLFRRLGLGTPADHHVHHKFFKYNFGHLFMWFDQLCGTYRDPKEFAPKAFNEGV